jgi:hypothetical protein
MGRYLNKSQSGKILPAVGKASVLLNEGAQPTTPVFQEDLVCVVENLYFDAAAYVPDPEELARFARDDGRKKQWLIVLNASELAE